MKILNVLNMKRIIFPFLVMVMLGWSGCMKEPVPNVTNYSNVPAIVYFSFETFQNMLLLPGNLLVLAPGMTDYFDGEMLWTDFTIDERNQPYSDYWTVSNLVVHSRINYHHIKNVASKEDLSDDYDSPINQIFIFPESIKNTMFFGFVQKAPSGQIFEYELIYTQDDVSDSNTTIPTLYIRSRKVNNVTGSETDIKTMCGFDMSFLSSFTINPDGFVKFYIKCLTGTKDGVDEYTILPPSLHGESSPFQWKVE